MNIPIRGNIIKFNTGKITLKEIMAPIHALLFNLMTSAFES